MGLQDLLRNLTGAFRWWVVVAPWEQAIRIRLGKRPRVLGPGIYWRVPALDRIYRQSVRRRYSRLSMQTVTTFDGRALSIAGCVGYSIRDIGQLYDTLHHGEEAVQTEAEAAIAQLVQAYPLSALTPHRIAAGATASLDLARYGIADVEICITNYVVVRTYRFITGTTRDFAWGGDDQLLHTSKADGP